MAKEKIEMMTIGQYLVSKDGKTKYIKLSYSDKAEKALKQKVDALVELLGSDVLFVNLFDAEFKEKYEIPDFVKGSIRLPLNLESNADSAEPEEKAAKKSKAKSEDDF